MPFIEYKKIIVTAVITVFLTTVVILFVQEPLKNKFFSDKPRLVATVDYLPVKSFEPFVEYYGKQILNSPTTSPLNYRSINNFLRVRLENKGVLQAENITLNIKGRGWFYSEIKNEVSTFDGVINIGEMKQGDMVNIEIWSSGYISPYTIENDLTIKSSNGGKAKIILSSLLYGWRAGLSRSLNWSIFIPFLLFLPLIIAFIDTSKKRKPIEIKESRDDQARTT